MACTLIKCEFRNKRLYAAGLFYIAIVYSVPRSVNHGVNIYRPRWSYDVLPVRTKSFAHMCFRLSADSIITCRCLKWLKQVAARTTVARKTKGTSRYDCRNKCVFGLRRNIVSDGAVVMSSSRLFQSLGPTVANDRSSNSWATRRSDCKLAGRWRTKTGSGRHVTDAGELFRQVPRCSAVESSVDEDRRFEYAMHAWYRSIRWEVNGHTMVGCGWCLSV